MTELAKAVKDLVDGPAKFQDWNKREDRQVLSFMSGIISTENTIFPFFDDISNFMFVRNTNSFAFTFTYT